MAFSSKRKRDPFRGLRKKASARAATETPDGGTNHAKYFEAHTNSLFTAFQKILPNWSIFCTQRAIKAERRGRTLYLVKYRMSNPFFYSSRVGKFFRRRRHHHRQRRAHRTYIFIYISTRFLCEQNIIHSARWSLVVLYYSARRLLYAFKLMTAPCAKAWQW